jgi:hypothetical protein
MGLSATFNNILVISWLSLPLVGETEVPIENHHLPQFTDNLYHQIVHKVHLAMSDIRTHTFRGDRDLLHR